MLVTLSHLLIGNTDARNAAFPFAGDVTIWLQFIGGPKTCRKRFNRFFTGSNHTEEAMICSGH